MDGFISLHFKKIKIMKTKLSLRARNNSPNHHIYLNNGTWCLGFTVHHPDFTSERVRKSLSTHNVEVARQRRDEILKFYGK